MAKNTNPVLDIFRENFDGGDPWGSTLEAHFQLAYTLMRHGVDVPDAWEFSPGMGTVTIHDNDPDMQIGCNDGSLIGWEFDLLMRAGHVDNLIHAGNVLTRYAALLDAAGHSY